MNSGKRNTCPECGADIVHRRGRYGWFVGCSNYPKCRWMTSELCWYDCNEDPKEYLKWKQEDADTMSQNELVNG